MAVNPQCQLSSLQSQWWRASGPLVSLLLQYWLSAPQLQHPPSSSLLSLHQLDLPLPSVPEASLPSTTGVPLDLLETNISQCSKQLLLPVPLGLADLCSLCPFSGLANSFFSAYAVALLSSLCSCFVANDFWSSSAAWLMSTPVPSPQLPPSPVPALQLQLT